MWFAKNQGIVLHRGARRQNGDDGMSPVGTPEIFDIGRVMSRMFGVLQRNFATFLPLAMILAGAPAAVVGFAQGMITSSGTHAGDAGMAITGLIFLGGAVLGWITNVILQGAVIHGTVNDLAGRGTNFGDSFGAGVSHILPLIGVGIVAVLAIGFGFVLLIVPGVLLALAWTVSAPVVVMERRGVFGAFARSAELTRNHRAPIFGLWLIFSIAGFILQMIIGVFTFGTAAVASSNAMLVGVVQAASALVLQTITSMVGSAGVASIYYELRQIKEGVGAEQLASLFD